jgi:hypothetical protein
MKRLTIIMVAFGAAFCLISFCSTTPAFSRMPSSTYKAHSITQVWVTEYRGVLVDNKCASKHIGKMDTFIKDYKISQCHVKEHKHSGYSLFVDGALIKFGRDSNMIIEKYMEQHDCDVQVVIKARKCGNLLDIVEISSKG